MDAETPRRHPGRWLGGLVGGLISLGVSGVALALGEELSGGIPILGDGGVFGLGLMGIPIGVLVGRQLLPAARSGGLSHALVVGLAFGLVAPPLGAVEIVLAALWPGASVNTGFGTLVAGLVALLPFAMAFSYIAVVATVPAGLVWGLLVRLIQDGAYARLEMPQPIARLGARHAMLAGFVALVLANLYPYVVEATDEFACRDDTYAWAHAWQPDGESVVLIGGPDRFADSVIRIGRDGARDVIHESTGGLEPVIAAGPDGRVAWLAIGGQADRSHGLNLWEAVGADVRVVGSLDDRNWLGLAWFRGSWVLRDTEHGLRRVVASPGSAGAPLSLEPVTVGRQSVGRQEAGDGLWASADGETVGWSSSDGSTDDRWFAVVDADGLDRILLPDEAYDAAVDGSGRAVVYRESPDGAWRSRSLDAADESLVAEARWEQVRVAADGSIAAQASGIGEGRLCLAPRRAP